MTPREETNEEQVVIRSLGQDSFKFKGEDFDEQLPF